eukprot:TRINITY_DN1502_c0_g1_i10.p2 TRINITY_DN1502_c0_g1~~TRINITY_DN1502_c0_g1_i10.p2  ORF type:complete len:166 (+),score=34.82 TRINITY_DN1502_c0_g1_i10:1367-1864(+)
MEGEKEQTSFFEKAVAYALLYQAQLMLANGDFDAAADLLTETFKANPKLCASENYIVFILSVLKKLEKVTKRANEGIIKCVDIIQNSNNFKESKSSSIALYLADLMLEKKEYETANKLFELLMSSVVYCLTFRATVTLSLATSTLSLCREGTFQGSCCRGWGRCR